MGRTPNPFNVYLFTRSRFKAPKKTKLRVRAMAEGRELFATFPILVVADFTTYYNSDGTLKEGYYAHSLEEKYLHKCIGAAYQAACNAMRYLLLKKKRFYNDLTSENFDDLVNHEYISIVEKYSMTYIARMREEDKEWFIEQEKQKIERRRQAREAHKK